MNAYGDTLYIKVWILSKQKRLIIFWFKYIYSKSAFIHVCHKKTNNALLGQRLLFVFPFRAISPPGIIFSEKKIHHYFYRNSTKRYEQIFFEYHTKMVQILQK